MPKNLFEFKMNLRNSNIFFNLCLFVSRLQH